MKRSFSLSELQRAIDSEASSPRIPEPQPTAPLKLEDAAVRLRVMRRSKSMDHLPHFAMPQQTGHNLTLPPIATLGLSLSQQHGYEELKRGRGLHGRLPTSSSHSSLVDLIGGEELSGIPEGGPAEPKEHGSSGQDAETRGAASALMELFAQPSPTADHAPCKPPLERQQTDGSTFTPPMMLPPLRELLAASQGDQSTSESSQLEQAAAAHGPPHDEVQATASRVATLKVESPERSEPAGSPPAQSEVVTPRASSGFSARVGPGWILKHCMQQNPELWSPNSGAGAGADASDGKHNKYCHFCQHVKVKRATSMLACENAECARRFCEHCLVTHLLNVVPPDGRSLQEPVDGKWLCPICRKVCCCAIQNCTRPHRHCKAYRYRQRRAEQAARRSLQVAATKADPAAAPAAGAQGSNAPRAPTAPRGPAAQVAGPGMHGRVVGVPGLGGLQGPMVMHAHGGFAMPPGAEMGMGMGMGLGMGLGGPGFMGAHPHPHPAVFARNI